MNNTSKITCVGDFLKVIMALAPEDKTVFYRGQGNAIHGINSSISRLLGNSKLKPEPITRYNFVTNSIKSIDVSGYSLAHNLFSVFREKHIVYSDVNIINGYSMNDMDLHVTAQHYGLSTRVIDWTYSPLVALYFAVEELKLNEKERVADAAVFMIWDEASNAIEVDSSKDFLKIFEAARDAHKSVYNACVAFHKKYYDNYVNNVPVQGATYYEIAVSFYNELQSIYAENLAGRTINLISTESIADFMIRVEFDLIGSPGFTPAIFNWVCTFLSNLDENYQRSHDVIDMYDIYVRIIEPLPINQRVKNQQGVLMFSKNIRDEVYPANCFNEGNTVSAIDETHLSQVLKGGGVVKIIIPNDVINTLRNELEVYGFTKDFIYPEIMSFTEYLQKKIVAKRSR